MDLEKVRTELDALERDPSLYEETNLDAREKALVFAAFVNEIVRLRGGDRDLVALARRARSLQRRLEAIDERLFRRLRDQIRSGNYTPEGLRHQFLQYTDYSARDKGQVHIGYDGLDALVSGVLQVGPWPEETKERTPEMIYLQATPARVILDLIDRVGLTQDDVFYDLGSGLGQIAILVNLLAGIRTKGIEFEPAFCEYAQACARELGLSNVEFINVDARDADYSEGTIFFMFTPFIGKILKAVLERLRHEARARVIKVCTYGPCTLDVAAQSWLRSIDANADHEFKLAIFSSLNYEGHE